LRRLAKIVHRRTAVEEDFEEAAIILEEGDFETYPQRPIFNRRGE
jgi:hypothetical protein